MFSESRIDREPAGPYKAAFAHFHLIRRHVYLKELVSWLKRGQYVRFLREICPLKKRTPFFCPVNGAIAWKLLKNTGN
jgi:hypothetical protein